MLSTEMILSRISKDPQIHVTLCEDRMEIILLYKQQLKTYYDTQGIAEDGQVKSFVDEVYTPYKEYWNAWFSEEDFIKWLPRNLSQLADISSPGIQLPFEIDFASIFSEIAYRLQTLTNKPIPSGKWYLTYRSEGDMGGILDGSTMFAHLLNLGEDGPDEVTFLLPHEISHQIFAESNQESDSLLHRIINEGIACYGNYIYWDKQFSPAKCIDFTEEEWEWSLENERKIYEYASPHFLTQDKEVIDKLSHWDRYPWEGTPDRLAYFIGFQICQSFVTNRGQNAWKEMYDLPVFQSLELSKYSNFIGKWHNT